VQSQQRTADDDHDVLPSVRPELLGDLAQDSGLCQRLSAAVMMPWAASCGGVWAYAAFFMRGVPGVSQGVGSWRLLALVHFGRDRPWLPASLSAIPASRASSIREPKGRVRRVIASLVRSGC